MRRLAGLMALGIVACSNSSTGEGRGRPPYTAPTKVALSPVLITEVYVADSDAAKHFAQLFQSAAPGSAAVSLAGFQLCGDVVGPGPCVDLVGELEPQARRSIEIGSLNLSPSAGELALVAPDATVHSYLAYGADPTSFGSSYFARAVASGAALPGEFIPIPFPMPQGVAVARVLDEDGLWTSGCALPTPDSSPVPVIDPGLCPKQPPALRLNELLAANGEGSDSWVEIENLTASPLRVDAFRLCQMPGCAVLAQGTEVAANGLLLVHLGTPESQSGAIAGEVFLPQATPLSATGELALLAPGPASVQDPAAFQSFVRYGDVSGTLASAAIEAGLWPDANDEALAPRVTGESLSADHSGQGRGAAWNPTAPTPGASNLDIRLDNDVWTSCSYPKPLPTGERAPASALAIERLERAADASGASVVLLNRAKTTIALADSQLVFGSATLALDALGSLDPGAELTVLVYTDQTKCPADTPCLADPAATVGDSGWAALLEPAATPAMVQYLQWGEGPFPREQEAFLARVWPIRTGLNPPESCALPVVPAGSALVLDPTLPGQSPPDYTLSPPNP